MMNHLKLKIYYYNEPKVNSETFRNLFDDHSIYDCFIVNDCQSTYKYENLHI